MNAIYDNPRAASVLLQAVDRKLGVERDRELAARSLATEEHLSGADLSKFDNALPTLVLVGAAPLGASVIAAENAHSHLSDSDKQELSNDYEMRYTSLRAEFLHHFNQTNSPN